MPISHDDLDRAFLDAIGEEEDSDERDNDQDGGDNDGQNENGEGEGEGQNDGDDSGDGDSDSDSQTSGDGGDSNDGGEGDTGDGEQSGDSEDSDGDGDNGDADQDEPRDHGERSKLGRRVANLERTLTGTIDQLKDMMAQVMEASGNSSTTDNDDDMFGDMDDDETLTVSSLRKMQRDQKIKENQKRDKYTNDYTAKLGEISNSEDPNVYKAVVEVMRDKFNVYRTGDGVKDCMQNYWLAKNHIITEGIGGNTTSKSKVKNNPLKKNKDKSTDGLGGGNSNTPTKTKSKPVVLDKWAQEFKAASGMSDESAAKALKNDAAYIKSR